MQTPERELLFEIQIQEHRKILYKVCNAYCDQHADREDLAQEILAQLWRSFNSFDGRCLFSTWMYRVALNTAISFSRREIRRKRRTISVEENVLLAAPTQASQTDDLRILHELIASLDPLNKALILLYLDGHDYQELSQILGISATNVATKVSRLKQNMKQQAAVYERREKETNT